MCVLSSSLTAQTADKRERLNKPIPSEARRLAIRGVELAASDRGEAGIVLLKKAIALAPNYVWAHEQYFSVRTFNQSRYDEVRSEYDRLAARDPDNPIYPLVIANTAHAPTEYSRSLYEKVIELAPDWAWAHYARALLADDKRLDVMVSEFRKCVDLDPTAGAYYSLVYVLENGLGKIDEAILMAERWAAQPEYRVPALKRLWQLRLARAKESEAGRAELRTDLELLTASAQELEVLAAVRGAYMDLLHDSDTAGKVARAIRRIDSSWYAERGERVYFVLRNESGVAWFRPVTNRQVSIVRQVDQLDDKEPREKIAGLEKLLGLNLARDLRIHIYQLILRRAKSQR
jgi:tetratricopeptide (TPR) repeat protein